MPSETKTSEKDIALSRTESNLVRELTRPDAKITAVIPANANAKELWSSLDACLKAMQVVNRTGRKLLPVIGRILLVLREHPEHFRSRGFDTWEDFIHRHIETEMGLKRTDVFDSTRLLDHFPDITVDEYVSVPRRSWAQLMKVTDHTKTDCRRLIEAAKKQTPPEFIKYLEGKGLLAPGEAQFAVVQIPTTHNIAKEITDWFENPKVQAHVGSKDRGVIEQAMIQECSTEWLAEVEA